MTEHVRFGDGTVNIGDDHLVRMLPQVNVTSRNRNMYIVYNINILFLGGPKIKAKLFCTGCPESLLF